MSFESPCFLFILNLTPSIFNSKLHDLNYLKLKYLFCIFFNYYFSLCLFFWPTQSSHLATIPHLKKSVFFFILFWLESLFIGMYSATGQIQEMVILCHKWLVRFLKTFKAHEFIYILVIYSSHLSNIFSK